MSAIFEFAFLLAPPWATFAHKLDMFLDLTSSYLSSGSSAPVIML